MVQILSSTTLGSQDVIYSASNISLTLPDSPEEGQQYYIKRMAGAGSLTIITNTSSIIDNTGTAFGSISVSVDGQTVHLVWSGTIGAWLQLQ